MKIIEIDVDCKSEILDVTGDARSFIRNRLGGRLEIVHPKKLKPPYIMIVDEEGLLKDLPLNPVGCAFYETHKHGQPIVGKIYIAKQAGDPYNGYDAGGLTDEDLKDFTASYGCRITALKEAVARMGGFMNG